MLSFAFPWLFALAPLPLLVRWLIPPLWPLNQIDMAGGRLR